jgi:hypothetical protein
MKNKIMTAVEYLIMVCANAGIKVSKQLQEEVLQMEKEQIITSYNEGSNQNGFPLKHEAEEYYNETYKNEDK